MGIGAAFAGLDELVEPGEDEDGGDAASVAAAMADQGIDLNMPLVCVPATNRGSDDS